MERGSGAVGAGKGCGVIYRILVDSVVEDGRYLDHLFELALLAREGKRGPVPWLLPGRHFSRWCFSEDRAAAQRLAVLRGAASMLSDVMFRLDLPVPDRRSSHRARYYFTERGWDRFGRAIVAVALQRGHTVKVIRRKNPRPSQITYADEWQVALLPPNRRSRGRDRGS